MTIDSLHQIYKECTGVCTDTRNISKGCMFFALRGGNFNGNEFAAQAIEQGALFAVVDEEQFVTGDNYILVSDALETLQLLANHNRKQFNIPFIGITGSNGKTTTKELINAVLSKKYKVHYTKGNLNNHIGVPLTLLSIPEDTEIAVIEMGANHIGEIAFLCTIAEPTHGLITNIGKAHLEGFGSLEGVARGKSELYLHLLNNDGQAFVNFTDEHLARMSKRLKAPLYYLKEEGYSNPVMISSIPNIVYRSEENVEVTTNIIGAYNFNNIGAALCVAKFFNVEVKDADAAISEFVSDNNRSQIIEKGSNTIILDAYNANPSSMKAALVNFDEMEVARKVIVLGDMFELGNEAEKEHKLVREEALQVSNESLFVGNEFAKVGQASTGVSDAVKVLKNMKIENATILIKGSRGMKLEQLLEIF